MRATDLYPNMQVSSTQGDTTVKAPSPGAQKVANAAAAGKRGGHGYGMIVLLGVAGILIGFKFFRERG